MSSCDAQGLDNTSSEASAESVDSCEYFVGEYERGNRDVAVDASYCFAKGIGVERSLKKAELVLERAMLEGNAYAAARLAVLILFYVEDERRFPYAIELLMNQANADVHSGAAFPLFVASIAGIGVPKNRQRAMHWLSEAESDGGVPAASLLLVGAYSLGFFDTEIDDAAAQQHWGRYTRQLGTNNSRVVEIYCEEYKSDEFLQKFVLDRQQLVDLAAKCKELAVKSQPSN